MKTLFNKTFFNLQKKNLCELKTQTPSFYSFFTLNEQNKTSHFVRNKSHATLEDNGCVVFDRKDHFCIGLNFLEIEEFKKFQHHSVISLKAV